MNGITPPIINFANAGDNCTTFPDNSNLLNCTQISYVSILSQFLAGLTFA